MTEILLAVTLGLISALWAQNEVPDKRANQPVLRRVGEPAWAQALRDSMREALERKEMPGGSVLIIHGGQTVFREAFGYADLETRRPFSVDDLCFIASLSKPISATLAVILDERGVLPLDAPVERWLPEFKDIRVQGSEAPASPPLIWHLLSHRSGLPGNNDPGAVRRRRIEGSAPPSLAETVAQWAKAGLKAEPGTRFAYGSAGYITLSRVTEVITGREFESLLREYLLQPLGMNRTTFRPSPEDLKKAPRRYNRVAGGFEPESRSYPVPGPSGWVNPAGGLFSTLDDMGRFLLLHLQRGKVGAKQIVSAEHLARMYQPHPSGAAYGLGLNVGGSPRLRHLGGSGTFLWLDVEHDAAGVLLTQAPWDGDHRLVERFTKLIATAFPAR